MKNLIIRTAVLVILWVNMILASRGLSPLPFDEAQTTEIVSGVLAGMATIWAWWKNNSFTRGAIEADAYLQELRNGGASDADT